MPHRLTDSMINHAATLPGPMHPREVGRRIVRHGLNPSASPARALLAESNPEQRRIGRAVLRALGFEVETVASGGEVLELLTGSRRLRASFDLVLIDVSIHGIDGCQTAARLRQSGYSGPIFAITDSTDEHTLERCLRSGFDALIPKPLTSSSLRDAASAALRFRSAA